LNQEGRVADEGDDRLVAIARRRPLRRFVNPGRPPRAGLEQHPRNGRERLPGDAGGIEKSRAVEMIARLNRHRDLCHSVVVTHAPSTFAARAHGMPQKGQYPNGSYVFHRSC
jgi:hypothetical protein